MRHPDLLVIGGGVVGLSVARGFLRRHPGAAVQVIDKETEPGAHASGRNSGVLHAGFYYSASSLKARYSAAGCAAWKSFCEERGVPLHRSGKLVVARTEADHVGLETLLERAQANGVAVERVSELEAREIEPFARTVGAALYSSTTATVDPQAAMRALAAAALADGVDVRWGVAWTGRAAGGAVHTSEGAVRPGQVVNAAGGHALRVAAAWGIGDRYRLVPFRGAYLVGSAHAPRIRACVYPVPDLGMPFLGVHLTTSPGGVVRIGPTALPAWGPDSTWRWADLPRASWAQVELLWRNPALRRHALAEVRKLMPGALVQAARRLARGIDGRHFTSSGRAGIRAQLVHRPSGALVSDFVVAHGPRSVHVLNAVSPAFTCAFPFAEQVCDELDEAA